MTTETKPEKPAADTLDVLDTTATAEYPTRIHDLMVDGKLTRVEFKVGEKRNLAAPIALRFLREPAFEITDPQTGERIMPTPAEPQGADFTLGPSEIVARLDELSASALAIRCRQEPGGEKFKPQTGRDAMLAFMTERLAAKRRAAEQALNPKRNARDTGDDLLMGNGLEPVNQAEMDRLFANA